MEKLHELPNLSRGIWEHYKGGRYRLLDVAYHSETLEPMVVYRALYGEGALWVRPASMWTEIVEVNGESTPRFRLIEAQESRR